MTSRGVEAWRRGALFSTAGSVTWLRQAIPAPASNATIYLQSIGLLYLVPKGGLIELIPFYRITEEI